MELEKENKGVKNGIFSSSSVSLSSCLLTILGRKYERGKWKRSYKYGGEEEESWHKSQMVRLAVTEPHVAAVENPMAGALWGSSYICSEEKKNEIA